MEGPRLPRLKTCLVLRLLKKLKNSLLSSPFFLAPKNCLLRWNAKIAKNENISTSGDTLGGWAQGHLGAGPREILGGPEGT